MDQPGGGAPQPEAPVAVFVSDDPRACAECAFVLTAVGIRHLVALAPAGHALFVDAARAAEAREHLARYAVERRVPPGPPPLARRPGHPLAWVGSAAFALTLLAIGLAIGAGLGPLDAYARGVADAALIRQGDWWRAITALTLHVDAPHLVANLVAGAWFGYLAGRRLGPGTAWLLTLLAAAAANGFEAQFGPVPHRSVGASTAVFAALGLLAAHAWHERYPLRARWVVRWAPLVGGVLLLGWLGTEGEHTDVMAHVLGFGCGIVAGLAVAQAGVARALERLPQALAGVMAVGLVVGAWGLALCA